MSNSLTVIVSVGFSAKIHTSPEQTASPFHFSQTQPRLGFMQTNFMKRISTFHSYISIRISIFLFSAVIVFLCPKLDAQVQQAWVARYDNGIADGAAQALEMTSDGETEIFM
jgi:hypothetical protein